MVETVSIKEQIKKLIELQKIDGEIYDYKRELREKPKALEQLKQAFEGKKVQLKAKDDQYKHLLLEHKALEGELKAQEDNIAKTNAQLSQLKTNKEYTAKIAEIEGIKANKSIIEEKILISFDTMDAAKVDVEKEKGLLSEEEKKYLTEKKMIEDSVKVLEDKVKVLDGQRQQILPSIAKNSLMRYDRVLQHTDGLAIVAIKNNSCGGCFINITQQVINQLKMNKELVFCEMCARILYLEEDL